jgi:hypothetical protein
MVVAAPCPSGSDETMVKRSAKFEFCLVQRTPKIRQIQGSRTGVNPGMCTLDPALGEASVKPQRQRDSRWKWQFTMAPVARRPRTTPSRVLVCLLSHTRFSKIIVARVLWKCNLHQNLTITIIGLKWKLCTTFPSGLRSYVLWSELNVISRVISSWDSNERVTLYRGTLYGGFTCICFVQLYRRLCSS